MSKLKTPLIIVALIIVVFVAYKLFDLEGLVGSIFGLGVLQSVLPSSKELEKLNQKEKKIRDDLESLEEARKKAVEDKTPEEEKDYWDEQ